MNIQSFVKKALPYLAAIVIFIAIAFLYCSPVLQGKAIHQSDVIMAKGMQKEMNDYHKETGKYTLWTNSMFGGMPTYQIGSAGVPNYNIFKYLSKIVLLDLPNQSVNIIFLYLLGFFILLVVLKVNPWVSIVGAIAYAFISYNFIIIGVGHINKAFVIGLIPPTIGGFLLIYQRKYIIGAILTIIALGLQIYFNHVQMTYYMIMALLVYFIVELIFHIKEKKIKVFLISTLIAAGSSIVAIIPNLSGLISTYEYSKDTNRGPSELVQHNKENDSKGINKEYALRWSYGKAETFTLLVPNLYGGVSTQDFTENSKVYDALIDHNIPRQNARQVVQGMPTTVYWGDQPGTSGPVYVGAIICFLFVLGLFLIDKKTCIWIITTTIILTFLSWGRNFMFFTDIFFNYFPLYNKFRAVSSILVIPSLLMPLTAILGIRQIMQNNIAKKDFQKYFLISLSIVGGLAFLLFLFGGVIFNFSSPLDGQMLKANYPNWIVDAVKDERLSLLRKDAFRSLIFIVLGAGIIYAFFLKKLKLEMFVFLLGLLVLIDMWGVDKRYLNDENFVAKRRAKQITPTQADLQIMQDKDPDYRVFNLTTSPFNESRTSYFHKSIGGYHAAKLRRYDELISYQLSKQNMQVIDMLNTKYFIVPGKNNIPEAEVNPGALGNAWFIDTIDIVDNADQEIDALSNFNASTTAIMDKRFLKKVPELKDFKPKTDTSGSIKLMHYAPNDLIYKSNAKTKQFAVFSEIYFDSGKGWDVFIDNKKSDHVRVDYVLRGMLIPAGNHTIEFKFEPKSFFLGLKIEMFGSILVILSVLLLIYLKYKKPSKSALT